MTGPEHHDVAEQVGSGTVPDRLRLDHNAAAAPEPKQIQAAEGGGVLVLLADRLVEEVAVALHSDVDVFVNGRAQDGAFFNLVKLWQIRAASCKADAQRSPRDDDVGRTPVGVSRSVPLLIEDYGSRLEFTRR